MILFHVYDLVNGWKTAAYLDADFREASARVLPGVVHPITLELERFRGSKKCRFDASIVFIVAKNLLVNVILPLP